MRQPTDIREVYRSAMRVYRLCRRDPVGCASVHSAAVSLVRRITGVWDVPQRSFGYTRRGQRQIELDSSWVRRPIMRSRCTNPVAVQFGAEPVSELVLSKPGRLAVWRSMTEFCRRTRNIKPTPDIDWYLFDSKVVPYFGLDRSFQWGCLPKEAEKYIANYLEATCEGVAG